MGGGALTSRLSTILAGGPIFHIPGLDDDPSTPDEIYSQRSRRNSQVVRRRTAANSVSGSISERAGGSQMGGNNVSYEERGGGQTIREVDKQIQSLKCDSQ